MANKFHIYAGGDYDMAAHVSYGGTLSASFTSEREAFFYMKRLEFEDSHGIHYMVCEGDERFTIKPIIMYGELWYDVVDKQTQTMCYGLSRTMQDAIEWKAHCEKYHWTGGKWADDYYKQFKAA